MCQDKNFSMIALFFDSGKVGSSFYGGEIFNDIMAGGEILKNSRKMVVSLGDIFENSYQDISPYLVKDDFCTIDFSDKSKYQDFKDWPFCWIIEDIEDEIALDLDKRLKIECKAYSGLSVIDMTSTDVRKQFWKSLIRSFSINKNEITVFGVEEEDFGFMYETTKYDLTVTFDNLYDSYFYDSEELLPCSRSSSFIKTLNDLEIISGKNDSDRGILEMNFSLVKEVSVAGVFIWKAIEDINKVPLFTLDYFPVDSTSIFMSLYQASQGVERLQKIIIQLLLYKKGQPKSEKNRTDGLLMSHNHTALHEWIIKEIKTRDLSSHSLRLLKILQVFYNNARYSRYSSSKDMTMELSLLKEFGSKCNESYFEKEVKHMYGKALGETSRFYYNQIWEIAHELNIYVYEVSPESPAMIVYSKYYDEDLYETLNRINKAKKELFWWIKKRGVSGIPVDVADLEELDLDPAMIDEYINEILANKNSSSDLYETVSEIYDEMVSEDKKNWIDRLTLIEYLVGNSNVFIEEDFDEEEEEK